MTKIEELLSRPYNTVGVIGSKADLKIAHKHPKIADVFEWRVDMAPDIGLGVQALNRPTIVTVRDESEGGKRSWTPSERAALYREHLSWAACIDVELETAHTAVSEAIQGTRDSGVGLIISCHDFEGVPDWMMVGWKRESHLQVHCDIFKIAVTPQDLLQFGKFIEAVAHLQKAYPKVRIAAMAMGKYGKISRELLGLDGSPLVYGYLGKANVKGQCRVSEIKKRIAQVS